SAESTFAAQESTVTPTESTETAETVSTETAQDKAQLPDGVYTAEFSTDSSMFHVSEACDGKGTLTVKDGVMTIHISLGSKKILNLYPGLAEDAAKDGAVLLEPTTDTVTYSDGMTEEVYGFDVPVPVIGEEFDLALIGTKGKWYDHKVKVSDPVAEDSREAANGFFDMSALADGSYTIELTMEGGSGRASIQSPTQITVADGAATAILEWSSPNYDYMLVNGEKYLPVNTEGNSVFEVPVEALDAPLTMIGDTVAMSTPHEVEYTVTFHSETLESAESGK
ncbi:MAG: iron transporter, partial [Waltera sp.]